MKNNIKINKYVNLTLISNFIFLDNFAGCCKKGNKGNNNKGYSGKGDKSTEINTTPNEEQHKDETPDNPKGNKPPITKDYTKEKNEFKVKLNEIDAKNNFLPDKGITLDKPTLEDKINKIKSDTDVNDTNIELRRLESQLAKVLDDLKQDYINRLDEITNGNNNLGLGLDIKLTKDIINSLDFDKNINDVKTDLDALEKEYFKQLKIKCDALKTKYDKLVVDKARLVGDIKKQVDGLCNLTDKNFKIVKYIDFNNLNEQINKINQLITGDENLLKEGFKNNYKKYSDVNDALNLNIDGLTEELSNKIEKFKIVDFPNIDNTLKKIYQSITTKITKLKTDLENKYKEITYKIALIPIEKRFTYLKITINIDENTNKNNYENLVNDIDNLKKSLINKLSDLQNEYKAKITKLNEQLKGLSIEEIDLKILDGLSYDKLNDNTIKDIEGSINNKQSECNKKIEEFKNDCKSKLDEATTNKDILKIVYINDLINNIKNEINNIQTTADKENVETLIKELGTKIKEEEKKEEDKKKDEAEKIKKALDEYKKNGIPKDVDYSYECTESINLPFYIYKGSDQAEICVMLKNNGSKIWAEDSKLIIDPSSDLKTDIVSLKPQKQNDERTYKFKVKNFEKYNVGKYEVIFFFYSNGKIRGEKITKIVEIKVKEKSEKEKEIEENIEKITEFRTTFNLYGEEYSNEKLFELLKDNDFNFESAFSALFN